MELLRLKTVSLLRINIIFFYCISLAGCNEFKDKKKTLPFYNTADFTAQWINKVDPDYLNIHTINKFSFYNQSGKITNQDSLDGHIYLANFFFSICPTICPAMMGNIGVVAHKFSKNNMVKLVSFSVMPSLDSVKTLNDYGLIHHIDPKKWYLLTGDKNEIYQLGRQSFFCEKRAGLVKSNTDFLHTDLLLLIDTKRRIRGVYNSLDNNQMQRVIEDVNILLKD
jgi:protein SCO1/2